MNIRQDSRKKRLKSQNRRKNGLISGSVIMIIVGILVYSLYVYVVIFNRNMSTKNQMKSADTDAQVFSTNMEQELQSGMTVTEALEDVIVAYNGDLSNFDGIAARLKRNRLYVVGVQIAPDGIISESFPRDLTTGEPKDLLNDPSTRKDSMYSRDQSKTIIRGPIDLAEGKQGFIIQNPVYLTVRNRLVFWGYTMAIVQVPDVFEETDRIIENAGYDYQLYTTGAPHAEKLKQIYGTREKLKSPIVYDFTYGESKWRLQLAPKGGWNLDNAFYFSLIGGFFIAVFIMAVTGMALRASRLHETILHIVQHDALTGVASRKYFSDRARAYLRKDNRPPSTYVSLDIDDFKLINDVYGHLTGDKALTKLGDTLNDLFHGETGFAGRMGGDEFAVLITGKDRKEAEELIHGLRDIHLTFTDDKEKEHNFSISIGYADCPGQADNLEELSRNADAALYEVKLAGKHGCAAYDSTMGKQSRVQLGFNLKDIGRNIPGAIFIYRADGSGEILYANDVMIQYMGCKTYEEFMEFTGGTFSGIIDPEDREKAETSIEDQLKDGAMMDYVHYRLLPKEGDPFEVLDVGRVVDHDAYGRIFYVLLIREKTPEEEGKD